MIRASGGTVGAICRTGVCAAACLLLVACSQQPAAKEPVVRVQAVRARQASLERLVHAEAVLYPIDQAGITPKISAPVAKFNVQRGDRVRRGELLAVLENQDLRAAAEENKGAYEDAQADYQMAVKGTLPQAWRQADLNVQAARQALEAGQKIYRSRQNLYRQGALPRKDLDQARVAYVEARNRYEIARRHLQALQAGGERAALQEAQGELESAKGKYESAEARLKYSEIRSPIDGVVTDRPLYVGEMAAAGTPLITVMNLTQVVARAHVPQEEAALVKVGDAAAIIANGEQFPGKVTVVSPALDSSSTTVEIWIEAANPGSKLRPGSNVEAQVVAGKVPNATVVPAAAVLKNREGESAVMVVGADGRAHEQAVTVGVRQGNEVQIGGGVEAGERVVTQGAFGLPDNTRVEVESGPATSSGGEPRAAGKRN